MRQRNVPFTVISDKKIPYGHFKLTVGNLCCTPAMGNSLVVKAHYTLGSRKC